MDYLLKASAVIAIFYLCFYLFLKKETFFQHNRWFLLIGITVALLFPLIVIPVEITTSSISSSNIAYNTIEGISTNNPQVSNEKAFDWLGLISIIYMMGLILFLIQFLFQFGSLILLLLKNPKNRDGIYTYVIVGNNTSPFSFFKWIVYNPEFYTKDELQLILIHEKVHVNQLHSLDILFTQLACVIFWFNPLIWLYRREVRQNLEYIADFETQTISQIEKDYQRLLLKTSVSNFNLSISNNFYNSLIKKRIIMLKKSRSNKRKQWRYLLILPLLAGLLMSMNIEEVYVEDEIASINSKKALEFVTSKNSTAKNNEFYMGSTPNVLDNKTKLEKTPIQNKEDFESFGTKNAKSSKSATKTFLRKNSTTPTATLVKKAKELKNDGEVTIAVITKKSTDSELDEIISDLKKEGLAIKIKRVKRNNKGEITSLKIEAKSKNSNANYNINSDDAIQPIQIVYDEDNDSISIGNTTVSHKKKMHVHESEYDSHKTHKSGKGSHVYLVSEDKHVHDEECEHKHKNVKVKLTKKGSKGTSKIVTRKKEVEVVPTVDEVEIVEIIEDEPSNNSSRLVITEEVNTQPLVITEQDNDNNENLIIVEASGSNNKITFSGIDGKDPLYIVDGKEITNAELEALKVDKIESISVLKGKSATESYGEKGKNGVILIITKN